MLAAVFAIALTTGAGCTYQREVSRRGMLSRVAGAESGSFSKDETRRGGSDEITDDPDLGLRREDPRGNITLVSNSARDVMIHVVTTLRDEEEELFLEQVLSEATKQEFADRGHDPVWAYRELKRRERDVRKLYTLMPYGEFTPGLFLKTIGRNIFRLQVRPSRDVPWTYVDVVIERGQWRLRWFG
ncbi:MAG: hypothetical protein DHS20C14_15300 [Phycisphaeraceae bacterium]|nr:MAG: hypothetical protein DHS20C14_15300 [Phycisphaeraceae bacterium]